MRIKRNRTFGLWAVVVVNWLECSPSAPTIRVLILLTPSVFFCKICV